VGKFAALKVIDCLRDGYAATALRMTPSLSSVDGELGVFAGVVVDVEGGSLRGLRPWKMEAASN
jgi:hypothetical protein